MKLVPSLSPSQFAEASFTCNIREEGIIEGY
jgi:hypothetical protein